MKYFTFFFCLLLAGRNVDAQAYIDIIQTDTSVRWFAAHDNTSLSGTTHSETSEHFTGQTATINSQQYAVTNNGLQDRHMRSDAQHRVYGLDANDTVETLYFAFDAQAGDTIPFHGFIGDSSLQSHEFFYAIDSVDSVDVNGSMRRQLHVNTNIGSGVAGQYLSLTWIEGVGEKNYGLHSVFVNDLYNGYSFCGIYKDTAYTYIAHLNCFELTTIRELSPAQRLQVYPIPTSAILTVINNTSEELSQYDLTNLSGQILYSGRLTGVDRNKIDLGALDDGVYFLRIRDDMGNGYTRRVVKR